MIFNLILWQQFFSPFTSLEEEGCLSLIFFVNLFFSIEMQNEFWYQLRKYKESNKEFLLMFFFLI